MGSLIDRWLPGFLESHGNLCKPHGWPKRGDTVEYRQFAQLWMDAFVAEAVSEEQAMLASKRVARDPPAFSGKHLAAILREIEALGQSRMGREQAAAESRGCLYCSANGSSDRQGWGWRPEDRSGDEAQGVLPIFRPFHDGN